MLAPPDSDNTGWTNVTNTSAIEDGDADPDFRGLHRIAGELIVFVSLACLNEAVRRCFRCWSNSDKARGVIQDSWKQAISSGLLLGSLVLAWYSTSITLILYNKWIIASWRKDGLPIPIFYTMNHMFLKGVFALIYHLCATGDVPIVKGKVLWTSFGIGVLTGLDIAFSNLSFTSLSASFYTMLKSTSLVFFLTLAVVFKLEPCRWKMVMVILTISFGVVLSSYGEVNFNLGGFILVMLSEMCAALRWMLTQILLQAGAMDSVTVVLYVAPGSTVVLIVLVLAVEWEKLSFLLDSGVAAEYVVLVVLPGIVAFLMLIVEVELVRVSSGLTMSIFGNIKSLVTIVLAIILFGEECETIQFVGLSIACTGISGYTYLKNQQSSKEVSFTEMSTLDQGSSDEDDSPQAREDRSWHAPDSELGSWSSSHASNGNNGGATSTAASSFGKAHYHVEVDANM